MKKDLSKYNIGWFSDNPLSCTGYATVTRDLLNRLCRHPSFNCYGIGHNYLGGQPLLKAKFEDNTHLNFTLLGNNKSYGFDLIPHYIKKYNFDIFCTLLDTFMCIQGWNNVNQKGYPQMDFLTKTLFYFPSDGGGKFPDSFAEVLRKMDYKVAMAKFGQKQLKKDHDMDVHHIPHGVNTNFYYPYKSKQEVKEQYELGKNFVVGTVARNQPRKMLDRTLKIFAEFAQDKQDVRLFLHLDPNDPAQATHLPTMVNDLKLHNKVRFSGMQVWHGFPLSEMPRLYNLMDVFLLSTSGEGFGIPTIEAMSCGVPVVVTDYTTTEEIIEDHNSGYAIKLAGTETEKLNIPTGELTGSFNVERGMCDIQDAVNKLNKLYDNAKLREKFGKNGRKGALQTYDWDAVVGPQWIKYFEEVLEV